MARLLPALVATAAVAALIAPAHTATPAKKGSRNLVVQPAEAKSMERRLALVIGNNAYADAPLTNPVNDARAMAQALERAGFTVILRTDANQRDMLGAVREFGNRLNGGGVGVFYYAGHGMQIKGRNYLIPVGTDIHREDEVVYQALDAQAVLDKMETAGNGTNIMILDACRNNPFARSFRSSQQGLAQMEAPVGTLVAFATAPGSIASDGQGRHGLYTSHLLAALEQPGLKVEEVFKQVRTAVRRDSQGRQVPWESTSLEGDFYFVSPPPATTPSPVDPLAAVDDALWETVKSSPHLDVVQAYLQRFPQGRHAAAAREKVASLIEAPPASATPAPPSTATASAPSPTSPEANATATSSDQQASLGFSNGPLQAGEQEAAPAQAQRQGSDGAQGGGETAHGRVVQAPDADDLPAHGAQQTSLEDLGLEDLEVQRRRAIDENIRRIEQIVNWGELAEAARPPHARTNPHGFTEGDRFRYRVIDRWRDEIRSEYGWRIDRIDDSGDLIVNDGAVRLNPLGQSIYTSDRTKATWTEWKPPMQILSGPMHVGLERNVEGTRLMRDESGRHSTTRFRGSIRVAAAERVTTQAGSFDTLRIDLNATGYAERSDGARYQLSWRFKIWFAPQLGTWVASDEDVHVGVQLESRLRRELIAVDMAKVQQIAAAAR